MICAWSRDTRESGITRSLPVFRPMENGKWSTTMLRCSAPSTYSNTGCGEATGADEVADDIMDISGYSRSLEPAPEATGVDRSSRKRTWFGARLQLLALGQEVPVMPNCGRSGIPGGVTLHPILPVVIIKLCS